MKISALKAQIALLQQEIDNALPVIANSVENRTKDFFRALEQEFGVYIDSVNIWFSTSEEDWDNTENQVEIAIEQSCINEFKI